jgi:Zn finger protein HypA/HybF involved in hydrogenase expression
MNFTLLEQNILIAKGLTAEQLNQLAGAGVQAKTDFATIGDAATLIEVMPGIAPAVAAKVMEWAVGVKTVNAAALEPNKVFVDSPDAVYCVHCNARQPKDYKTGELCPSCGKQAEPVQSCYWCSHSGPGKFCRGCGAEFVPLAEYDLAILLKREGVAKEEISRRLKALTPVEKDVLWGRVRRIHG